MSRNRTRASNKTARDYSDVPLPSIDRSVFDRSISHQTTFNAGELIPIDREELLPGDSITIQPAAFARTTTLEVPIFSNVYMDIHYFAVPLRLIWENSEEFFGAEPGGPGTRVDHFTPKLDMTTATGENVAPGTLHDYIGIPPNVRPGSTADCPHNLYGRAYNLIYNEWYRDGELNGLVQVDTDDGTDAVSDYVILKRNKQRDRFTSARPWPQKGPDVDIPLGTTAPVISDGSPIEFAQSPAGGSVRFRSLPATGFQAGQTWPAVFDLTFGASTGLQADLSSAAAASVQDLRTAIATQHLFEMFSRAGSARYVELNHTVWGVRGSDMRLQRPEYLGGTTAKLYVNPVQDTAGIVVGSGGQAVGNLGAFGVAMGAGRPFTYSAEEHCVLLGIASVRTPYLYSEGIDKDLMRNDRFDYAWPQFQNVGEQPIYNRELFWSGTSADQDVFGYEPRYQEYRERYNRVSSLMRPQVPDTLAYWHLGQEFGATQNLNGAFIEENPPFDRVTTINQSIQPTFKADFFVKSRMARPLSAQGHPGLKRL